MFDSIKENIVYIAVLVILLVALIFIWKKALTASKKTSQRRAETLAKLDRFKALKEKYSVIRAGELSEIPDGDLIDAVMLRIWKKLGDENVEMENFKALSLDEKDIYTAWYIRDEVTNEGFASFFRNCGHVLSGLSQNVFNHLGLSELQSVMKKACDMFDENSDISCDRDSIAKLQSEFNGVYNEQAFCAAAASFIRSRPESFADKDENEGGEN